MTLLLIICLQEALAQIVDELHDWQDVGLHILLSGTTRKAQDGFILVGWSQPIPDAFYLKMAGDHNFLDYIPFDPQSVPFSVPAPTQEHTAEEKTS